MNWQAEVTGWNVEGESVEGIGRGETEDAAIEAAYLDARWIVETGDARTWQRAPDPVTERAELQRDLDEMERRAGTQ